MAGLTNSAEKPTIMVTNDDGIDAPGLRALVRSLVSSSRYNVLVCAPDSCYSGTVAGAREAFLNGIPSVSISYDWAGGQSTNENFSLSAEACLPIIGAITAEIRNGTYPKGCFLNIDLPTNVLSHKGYKLTKQGKSIFYMGWRPVSSGVGVSKMTSAMTMEIDGFEGAEDQPSTKSQDNLLFKREVKYAYIDDEETDRRMLEEGYITVTPLGATSPADAEQVSFFRNWLPGVCSSAL